MKTTPEPSPSPAAVGDHLTEIRGRAAAVTGRIAEPGERPLPPVPDTAYGPDSVPLLEGPVPVRWGEDGPVCGEVTAWDPVSGEIRLRLDPAAAARIAGPLEVSVAATRACQASGCSWDERGTAAGAGPSACPAGGPQPEGCLLGQLELEDRHSEGLLPPDLARKLRASLG